MTPTTITHPQRLYEELARIRRQGWSYDNGEDYADVRCVAAPCLTPITSLPLRFRWSVPAYKSMKNTVIIWRARLLPAPGIFHVCWDGKVPLTYRPHNNGEHHDPTKIKQVRAWFTGGATAEKALAAVIITTRGESLD